MREFFVFIAASSVIGLGGCAALQQAPLVYASKVSIGIDASGTSTETPGFSINVGYKQVDTAYVPVAVARDCKSDSVQTCRDKAFEIIPLSGNNDVIGKTKVSEQSLADAKAAIDVASKDVERSRLTLEEAQVDAATKIRARDVAKAAVELAAELDKAAAVEASKKAQAVSDTAQSTLVGAQRTFETAQSKLGEAGTAYSKLASPPSLDNTNQRKDAFSVYGSFDGKTKNSVENKGVTVGLDLGRTFSTGVASQNLTEGVRSAACLDSAARILDKAADKADATLIKSLVDLCEARAR